MFPKKTDPTNFPDCPLRKLEFSNGFWRLRCKAGGKSSLGTSSRKNELLKKWCSSCAIPEQLSHEMKPCLYLVPVRFRWDKHPQHTFSCRWFYRLTGNKLVSEVWKLCGGCPHWFPRPPNENLVPGQEEWAEKVMTLHETERSEGKK